MQNELFVALMRSGTSSSARKPGSPLRCSLEKATARRVERSKAGGSSPIEGRRCVSRFFAPASDSRIRLFMFERVPSGTRSNSSRPGSMDLDAFAERRSQRC